MKVKIAKGGLRIGTWGYRLIAHPSPLSDEDYLRVHEVHYDANGLASGWDEGAHVAGEGIGEVLQTVARILRALEFSILKVKRLDDGHEVLVERDTGERAHGIRVRDLKASERHELEAFKSFVEKAVKRK